MSIAFMFIPLLGLLALAIFDGYLPYIKSQRKP
jgi:hypothetical protein